MIKIKNRISFFTIIIGALILLQSCGKSAHFDQTYSFDDHTWNKEDTAVFKVKVDDLSRKHDFLLNLRTSREYLYSDLWIYIMITAPDSTTSKVAQKIPLANPDGSWIGKVSGALVESKLRFDTKAFPMEGEYVFKLLNATQKESISHVEDIGLRIE